jgi:transposase
MILEGDMIKVDERERMRRAYHVEGKSIREIARELHHSRDTVKKMIESTGPASYTLKKARRAPVLGPYMAQIDELLEENERLPRKQRRTGRRIYEELREKGYAGSESRVRGYIAEKRREQKKRKVYIPLEFDPGEDGQMDWGEAQVVINGAKISVQLFCLRLCYSRRLFVMAFPTQRQEAFFEGHVRAFHFFEGVPKRISYDNLKAAVFRILEGRNREEQERFILFRSHHLFESRFCTPGQGNEKGRVEKGVGFGRRNYLAGVPSFASFAELNEHLLRACRGDDARRVDRQPVTIGEAWRMEKPYLLGLPTWDFDCCVSKEVSINGYSQVEYETNRYSVPCDKTYDKDVVLKAYPFRIQILHLDKVLASHPRCYDRKRDILDPLHYLSLLEQRPGAFDHAKPVRRWRESWPPIYEDLLDHLRKKWPDSKGVREFIRVLRLHKEYPQDLIAEAVKQALAYGCGHLDGIQLCLRQLTEPAASISALDLSQWPQLVGVGSQELDLSNYDQLLSSGAR